MSTESTHYKIATFYKGQTIFKEGQQANTAYLVKTGLVAIQKKTDNAQAILAHIKAGQIFGEMGIISGEPRNAAAIAEEYCELVVIDQEALGKTLLQSPNIIQAITKALIERLRSTSKKITAQPAGNVFIGTCTIIDFMYANHSGRGGDGEVTGIPYPAVCAMLKKLLSLSQLDITAFMKKLQAINALQLVEKDSGSRNGMNQLEKEGWLENANLLVKLTAPQTFLKTANSFYQEFKDTFPNLETNQEFVDIPDFAAIVNTTPEMIYQKICGGDIPENMLFLSKKEAVAWFHEAGSKA